MSKLEKNIKAFNQIIHTVVFFVYDGQCRPDVPPIHFWWLIKYLTVTYDHLVVLSLVNVRYHVLLAALLVGRKLVYFVKYCLLPMSY